MTKTLVQTIVIVVCMSAFWLSLSTKLDTNSRASGDVSSKLKDQVEAYRKEATTGQTTLLTHVDTTQEYLITAIMQNSTLAEQNQKLLASIDSLTKQVLALTEQNTEMAQQNVNLLKQIKVVNDMQTQILTQHTEALQEAKIAAKQSSIAAKSAQIDTKRALRAIVKPTPKPWYSRLFSQPTGKK